MLLLVFLYSDGVDILCKLLTFCIVGIFSSEIQLGVLEIESVESELLDILFRLFKFWLQLEVRCLNQVVSELFCSKTIIFSYSIIVLVNSTQTTLQLLILIIGESVQPIAQSKIYQCSTQDIILITAQFYNYQATVAVVSIIQPTQNLCQIEPM
ncbi:Hypothetical_protein [Hexamita inflata]|uniref:Hypothetical_protein n=1 Tax=Hexamita inflata TaxID=28002 RepID=A0AA86QDD9_9EUKA|nr:Hypothetical protein HINF_LOCUS3987 [Hexamita inflata]CAI9956700.1 Hypothetical protein HINF_LOCUS44345 [Hexamita inflata]